MMKIIDLSTDREKVRTFLRLVCLFSLFVIIFTFVYGLLTAIIQGVNVVGETLVNFEAPSLFGFPLFYLRPVTWLFAAILALYFSLLELNVERLSKWSKPRKDFLKFLALFIGSMAFYEVMFNFTLWRGLIGSDSVLGELKLDLMKSIFPNPDIPWNLIFATRMFTVITIMAAYSVFYLQRIETKMDK
jgi:hypothetical protein